ncbi:MAG: hypothetical protein ACI9VO_002496 [Colwellia sp.]|jgi:hypothetical protein
MIFKWGYTPSHADCHLIDYGISQPLDSDATGLWLAQYYFDNVGLLS